MRRSGFTMVELIFVIVIIGILAAVALPKFSGVKDNAKANTEVAAMNSLEGSIVGEVEFQLQDYKNRDVNWHGRDINDANPDYAGVNSDRDVLKKIMKKGDKFTIVGYAKPNVSDTNSSNDVLLLKGEASSSANGIKQPTDGDIIGKPDRNDFWVFNPNNFDLNVSTTVAGGLVDTTIEVEAESIKLLDVNSTISAVTAITVTDTSNNLNTDAFNGL